MFFRGGMGVFQGWGVGVLSRRGGVVLSRWGRVVFQGGVGCSFDVGSGGLSRRGWGVLSRRGGVVFQGGVGWSLKVGWGFSLGEGLGCSFNESMRCSREGVGVFFQGEADEVCTVSRRHPCLSLTLNLLASSSLVLGVKMMFSPSRSTTALVRHGSSGKKGKGMFSRLLVQLSVCGNPC